MKNLTDIQDNDIALAIEAELRSDESVPAHLIDVQSKNGIVTLSDVVDNLWANLESLY